VAVDEVLQFYKVYHSMRYVRNKLVLRLQKVPDQALLAAINAEFRDVLTDGDFQLGGPLPEEKQEPELNHLPRLIFRFNRRSLGRLRQLIDCLNRGSMAEEGGRQAAGSGQ
jgi:hypothetical protein